MPCKRLTKEEYTSLLAKNPQAKGYYAKPDGSVPDCECCEFDGNCFSAQLTVYNYVKVDTSHPTSVDDGGYLIFTPSNWTTNYFIYDAELQDFTTNGAEAGCQAGNDCMTVFTWYGPTPDWNVYFTIGVAWKEFDENSSTQVYWADPGPDAVCCDGYCGGSC